MFISNLALSDTILPLGRAIKSVCWKYNFINFEGPVWPPLSWNFVVCLMPRTRTEKLPAGIDQYSSETIKEWNIWSKLKDLK